MHKARYLYICAIVQDVKMAMSNKIPRVGSWTLKWLCFCIETSNKIDHFNGAQRLCTYLDGVPQCCDPLGEGFHMFGFGSYNNVDWYETIEVKLND